jgi:hypothetical protein
VDSTAERVLVLDPDLALCTSGFEPRAAAIPSLLRDVYTKSGHVICFDTFADDSVKQDLDHQLSGMCQGRVLAMSPSQFGVYFKWLYEQIVFIRQAKGRVPVVLIDYTCMPKPFYIGAMVVATFAGGCRFVFGYNLGRRSLEEWQTSEVDAIYAIPGLEGRVPGDGRQVFLFSLGFDGHQTAALEEILQPHILYSLIADPGAAPEAGVEAEKRNNLVIARSEALIRLPINAVTSVIGVARDIVGYSGDDAGLVMVPVGPKPHALALGITALLEPNVTFLHILTRNPPLRRTEASLDNCWTEVEIMPVSTQFAQ